MRAAAAVPESFEFDSVTVLLLRLIRIMSAKVDSPKKGKLVGKAKRKSLAAEHPKVSEMVLEAITSLHEKNGSSLQAIKKYIAENFSVDSEKVAIFIRRYIKTQVISGALVQTKGKGASGSFKISNDAAPSEPRKRPSAAVRAAAAAQPRAPKPVKAKKSPKSLAKEKKRSPKKAKAPKPKKASPRKAKKGSSTPKQKA